MNSGLKIFYPNITRIFAHNRQWSLALEREKLNVQKRGARHAAGISSHEYELDCYSCGGRGHHQNKNNDSSNRGDLTPINKQVRNNKVVW